jgi:hypothetical protein
MFTAFPQGKNVLQGVNVNLFKTTKKSSFISRALIILYTQ